jgi:hypothetical protein
VSDNGKDDNDNGNDNNGKDDSNKEDSSNDNDDNNMRTTTDNSMSMAGEVFKVQCIAPNEITMNNQMMNKER